MRGGIIVWWAFLSTSLGEEMEWGRVFFGCRVHYEYEGEPDCCIMMKVLSQVSMKFQAQQEIQSRYNKTQNGWISN